MAWCRAAWGRRERCTWPAGAAQHVGQRSTGGRGKVDEGGPGCKCEKGQGPHCNVLVTFKPELKWKWTQKQKCRVCLNLQLCFKVHWHKS
jgi:hypothetical protein